MIRASPLIATSVPRGKILNAEVENDMIDTSNMYSFFNQEQPVYLGMNGSFTAVGSRSTSLVSITQEVYAYRVVCV